MRFVRSNKLLLLLFSCFTSLTISVAAAPVLKHSDPIPLSLHAILFPNAKLLLLLTPEGDCEAVDPSNGKSVWDVKRVRHFLTAIENRVYLLQQSEKQSNEVRVVGIDVATGKVHFESDKFYFHGEGVGSFNGASDKTAEPEGALPILSTVDSNRSYHFALKTYLKNPDSLTLVWSGYERASGGAPTPTAGGEGVTRVNLTNGKVIQAKTETHMNKAKSALEAAQEMPSYQGLTFKISMKEEDTGVRRTAQATLHALDDGKPLWERKIGPATVTFALPAP